MNAESGLEAIKLVLDQLERAMRLDRIGTIFGDGLDVP
jgi:hypothetical protein